MTNEWILISWSVDDSGKQVSQTWKNTDGRQFALAGITLEEYCQRRGADANAREILAKKQEMGL